MSEPDPSSGSSIDYFIAHASRFGWPASDSLAAASESLQRVLRDHAAAEAQQQLAAWQAVQAGLQVGSTSGSFSIDSARFAPTTYVGWAQRLLAMLRAPSCGQDEIAVVSWEAAESTQALNNPLATTHATPGALSFNAVGVKDYISLWQGLAATRATLVEGSRSYGYRAIIRDLRNCAGAVSTSSAIRRSAWCEGCAQGTYVLGLLRDVQRARGDYFARLIVAGG